MGCCGKTGEGQRPGFRRPGCILCRIWTLLTTEKTPEGDPCVVVPGRVIRKPDPCIYDQFLLMQLNQPVTWDNPDVAIFLGGVEQYTYDLKVSTEYDVAITVHNSSRDEAADGTRVEVRWIEFGAGGQIRHPIDVLVANVPVWPATDTVTTKWTTPDVPGHYCIEVELFHPNDGNPSNNRGWNNTQVYAAHSAVTGLVRIFNRYVGECPQAREGAGPLFQPHHAILGWGPIGAVAALLLQHRLVHGLSFLPRMLLLIVAGYVTTAIIGGVLEAMQARMRRTRLKRRGVTERSKEIDCHFVELTVDSYVFNDGIGKDFDPDATFKSREPAWPATVTPSRFAFLPGEAFRDVELRVDAPDGPGPAAQFNVTARQGGVPSGGVTVTVTRGG